MNQNRLERLDQNNWIKTDQRGLIKIFKSKQVREACPKYIIQIRSERLDQNTLFKSDHRRLIKIIESNQITEAWSKYFNQIRSERHDQNTLFKIGHRRLIKLFNSNQIRETWPKYIIRVRSERLNSDLVEHARVEGAWALGLANLLAVLQSSRLKKCPIEAQELGTFGIFELFQQ